MKSALIIISHYNAWPTDQLVALLDQTQSIPSGYPFRRLVVVNRAVDRPLELPARHADVEIIERENSGYNIGAWDHGWRTAARADYYLFLQEECKLLRPDWLGAFVRRLERPEVGLVGESLSDEKLSWERLDHLRRFDFYQGRPGEPVLGVMPGIREYLGARGVDVGRTGEHLQSLIVATRREVLEAIDGFLIGTSKGDAIACEVGMSRAVASKGWKLEQIGLYPFRYIHHPQWDHGNLVFYGIMINWALRFAPITKAEAARNAVFQIRHVLSSLRPGRLLPGRGRG